MFAVLHIADFALQAVLRTERTPAGLPAALFSGTGKKSVVIGLNPAARAAGITLGMTAPQAVARSPSLLIRAPQAAAVAEARAALLAVGFTLSPAIEDTASGICTIDLRGADTAKLPPLIHAALAELARLGLSATAGLARTPLLALYGARATRDILRVADEMHFLAPLPLAVADPTPELATVLRHWGLRTLGDLTKLPRDEIIRRFGAEGLALWQRATGGDPRPLRLVVPPQTFSATMEFEHEVETLEPLLFILRRFLDRLTLELTAAQLVAAELALTLRLEDERAPTRSFRLPEPTADAETLFRALHTHLESAQTASAIVALELRLTPARPLVRQQGLFETGLRDPHGFAETLARVSALVGAERIGTPQREDTHRPDAVKLVAPPPVIPPAAAPPVHAPLSPPLRRFRPPLRVNLSSIGDGAIFLWSDRLQGEITYQSQPYPRSGDWWQADRRWARIETDIALAEGGLYRLVQIGDAHFVEGEYD